MNSIFYQCSSSLSFISKWNTDNVSNMISMFYKCSSLSSLPDISKWNTNNVTDKYHMFFGCINIIIPKIISSKFNL